MNMRLKSIIKIAAVALAALLSAGCLAGCGGGTFLSSDLTFRQLDGGKNAEANAKKVLDAFEKKVSVEVSGSEIDRINAAKAGEPVEISGDTAKILLLCKGLYQKTGQKFSPSLFALSQLWGFSDENYRVPSDGEIAETLKFCNFDDVEISGTDKSGVYQVVKKFGETKLDLGGVAKGHGLSLVEASLRKDGVTSGIVNMRGTLLVLGDKAGAPFNIGVTDPRSVQNNNRYAAEVNLKNCFVSTSADEQQFTEAGKTYSHIFDPATGRPAETDLMSATVFLPLGEGMEGALCDLYSTALFAMGMEEAIAFAQANEIEVLLLSKDNKYYSNAGGLHKVAEFYQPYNAGPRNVAGVCQPYSA